LVERIDDLDPEPFHQLQRGDANVGKEGVDNLMALCFTVMWVVTMYQL
jgi:hypothetical protein